MNIRKIKGKDFVEAKEALTDSLLNLTYRFVSGEGADGEFVYGDKPSRKFVSGFLLPAMSESGADDETNDIHISNIGVDLQVRNPPAGKLGVEVSFSVYIRVLPIWEEIERYEMKPIFKLRSTVQRQIRDAIRDRTNALLAEEQNKPEDQRRRRGLLRVIASEEIYHQFGIMVRGQDGMSQLDQEEGSEEGQEPAPGEEGTRPHDVISAGSDVVLPDNLVQPADIPQKWRRFSLSSERLSLPLATPDTEIEELLQAFADKLWADISQKVTTWVSSSEGQQWAYREQPVVPTQIATKDAWDAFLQVVRQTPPVIRALLPTWSNLRLSGSSTTNLSDASVCNVRVSFGNQNNTPSRN